MKKELIFWASNGFNELNDNFFPNESQISIQENFRSQRSFDFDWVGFNNPNPPSLPNQLYLVIKSIKNPKFDVYDYFDNFLVVSNELLNFLEKYGYSKDCVDKCPILLVNRQGKELTNRNFFLLRIHKDTITRHQSLINFEKTVNITESASVFSAIKPYENIYTESSQKIFTPCLPFYPKLMFTEDLKEEIFKNFDSPRLYTSEEWIISKQKIIEAVNL